MDKPLRGVITLWTLKAGHGDGLRIVGNVAYHTDKAKHPAGSNIVTSPVLQIQPLTDVSRIAITKNSRYILL